MPSREMLRELGDAAPCRRAPICMDQDPGDILRDMMAAIDRAEPDRYFCGPDGQLVDRGPRGVTPVTRSKAVALVLRHCRAVKGRDQDRSRFRGDAPAGLLVQAKEFYSDLRPLHRILHVPQLLELPTPGGGRSRSPNPLAPLAGEDVRWAAPGYSPEPRAWFEFPTLPPDRSLDDFRWALDLMLGDFNFATPRDRVVAALFVLSPLLRHVAPYAPGLAITAPCAGAGKSLLVKVLLALRLGRLPRLPPSIKRSRGSLETGYAIGEAFNGAVESGAIILENWPAGVPFHSDDLLQFMTWRDAVTGPRTPKSARGATVHPAFTTTFVTGVALRFETSESERRFLVSRLAPGGGGFRHTEGELLDLVCAQRRRILGGLAAAVEEWWKAGAPRAPTRFSSFEEWGRIVPGVLSFAAPDLLDTPVQRPPVGHSSGRPSSDSAVRLDELFPSARARSDAKTEGLLSLLLSVPPDPGGLRPFVPAGDLAARLELTSLQGLRTVVAKPDLKGRKGLETSLGKSFKGLVEKRTSVRGFVVEAGALGQNVVGYRARLSGPE